MPTAAQDRLWWRNMREDTATKGPSDTTYRCDGTGAIAKKIPNISGPRIFRDSRRSTARSNAPADPRPKGQITPVEEARLMDLRNRTRHGMRCLDPLSPPKELVPDHISGELCRLQRCTGCPHGVAFDDAVKPLAYALADLHAEKRLRPLDAWRGTSLEDEEKSIAATLRQFDQDTVRAAYQARVEELQSGTARVFDAYPLY